MSIRRSSSSHSSRMYVEKASPIRRISRVKGVLSFDAGSLLGATGGFAGCFGVDGAKGSFGASSSTTMSHPGFLGAAGGAGAFGMDGMETIGEEV